MVELEIKNIDKLPNEELLEIINDLRIITEIYFEDFDYNYKEIELLNLNEHIKVNINKHK